MNISGYNKNLKILNLKERLLDRREYFIRLSCNRCKVAAGEIYVLPDSSDDEKLRPSIVSYNANSDPDNTIRFREQFRTFNTAPNPPDSASSKVSKL